MKVAVIGGGISGIATAQILKKNGVTPVVFEKSSNPGGVWATAYPDVHLQNIYSHYHLTDFPWPEKPDYHPSGKQILDYLVAAIETLGLDVRTGHEVTSLIEDNDGWLIKCSIKDICREEHFDFVIIATGQFTQPKVRPHFENEALFEGSILTELDVRGTHIFNNKNVVVVGFGKSALDMTVFAAAQAATVHHVFRNPHWMLQERILGMHYTNVMFNRFGTVMIRSWVQPTAFERFFHRQLKFVVMGFWKMIAAVLRYQLKRHGKGKGKEAKQRLQKILPRHALITDLGSKSALAPKQYFPHVAKGRIIPHHSTLIGFEKGGIVLGDGSRLPCNQVLLCLGSDTPQFPFLPQHYRDLLEKNIFGTQLYRHIMHPKIPRLAFSGFNHGFMHVPSVELATQWICAVLHGELQLPDVAEMEQSMESVNQWKESFAVAEPARNYSTSVRFQQYLDVLLKDLGLSPYRKMPNIFAEVFSPYKAADYRGVTEEYLAKRGKRKKPLKPMQVNT